MKEMKEKYLKFTEGERTCYECGMKFEPARPEEVLRAEVGDEVYCHCPVHARYTMAIVSEK